ncbi:hypothetical protein [Sorangium sp. So ce693]|uniref:hypothetical protein n=1 Tax=Sorangium sp. So ce693 TaxID=3133318 RepID=UPI003F5FA2EB
MTGKGSKRRWGPQALAVLRALHREAAVNAEFFGERVSEAQARAKADPSPIWWEIELPRLQTLQREAMATEFALLDLLGSQGPLPRGAHPDAAHLNNVLDIWEQLSNARRRFIDAGGGQAPQPASEPQEESRQACEPAGPARGSRRAEALLPNESGPGGALTPAEPNATPRKKGRAHDP